MDAKQCALAAPGVEYRGRNAAFHFALSNMYSFDASLRPECDFYNSAEPPVYMTSAAVKALSPYGPAFFHVLHHIAPALGRYGKFIMAVKTEKDVDDHLNGYVV